MKTIRFIRHAETAADAGESTTDPADTPLTAKGKQAAALAAANCDGATLDLIVVSPYLGARQTAEPFIARFPNARVETWPVQEFTYINPARCVETTAADRRPLVDAYWSQALPTHADGPEVESFKDFTGRARGELEKLRGRPETHILVFCHGIFMSAAAFYQNPDEDPCVPDSMRRFHQYTQEHPVPNLGIWGDSNPPKRLATPFKGNSPATRSSDQDARSSVDHLIRDSLAYNTTSKLKELFAFIGETTVHSPYNAMLLHTQNPKSKLMLSASHWQKLGRCVNPGARPYVILATMGPVGFVFDETETTGKPLNIPEQGNLFHDGFAVTGNLNDKVWSKLLKSCLKIGVEVAGETMRLNRAGLIQSKGSLCRIEINAAHPLEVKFITMAHELAHLFCGHLGRFQGICPDRSRRNHASDEIEAEATAYLVAKRMGLKSHSEGYISSFLTRGEQATYSLDAILVAAGKIEAMCNGTFRLRKWELPDSRQREPTRGAVSTGASMTAPSPA